MKNRKKDTICPLPWSHLMIQPNGNIQPCCMTPTETPIGNTKVDSLEEVWNGDELKTIRKEMLNGERPVMCSRCYLMEDTGVISPRQSAITRNGNDLKNLIKDTNPETGHNDNFILKYWDFRFSNICNFKCRMCGTFASSKWTDDEIALHGRVVTNGLTDIRTDSKVEIFDYIDRFIGDVKEIYFAGGEPLIMDEHYIILEKLINSGRTDVNIRYNTNFSHIKFKKWNLQKLWKPFIDDRNGKVDVIVSLDAVGDLSELARNGTNWNELYNNIQSTIGTGVNLFVSPTISILNVFGLPELFDTIRELGVSPHNIIFNNFLTEPHHFDIRILTDELKTELIDKLLTYKNNLPNDNYKFKLAYCVDSCINFFNNELNIQQHEIEIRRRELFRVTAILDIRRNENFIKVNPQFENWFNEIKYSITKQSIITDFFKDKTNEYHNIVDTNKDGIYKTNLYDYLGIKQNKLI
jgi:radical SAM protein with 4Fe4S-binding SPASM domain